MDLDLRRYRSVRGPEHVVYVSVDDDQKCRKPSKREWGVLQNGGRERGKMDRGCSLRGRGEEASELNRRGVGRWLEGKSKRPARG